MIRPYISAKAKDSAILAIHINLYLFWPDYRSLYERLSRPARLDPGNKLLQSIVELPEFQLICIRRFMKAHPYAIANSSLTRKWKRLQK